MVSLIQTTIGTVLGPLVGQLDAQRQTIERQADKLVKQAETIGELRDENRALAARTEAQTVESTTEAAMSRWRRHLPWLIVAAVLTVMVALFVFAPGVR